MNKKGAGVNYNNVYESSEMKLFEGGRNVSQQVSET